MTTPRTLPGTVKEQVVAGFGQAVSGYDEGGTEFFKDMGARLVDLAGVHAGADVLDVGCGKGAVTIPAARRAGEGGCVHAIDLARPMLEAAAALARQSGLGNVTVARGDAEDPPFAAGTFDVILAGFVIQLLPRPAPGGAALAGAAQAGRHPGLFLGAGAGPPVGAGDGRPGRPRPARHVPVRGVLPPPPVRRHRPR